MVIFGVDFRRADSGKRAADVRTLYIGNSKQMERRDSRTFLFFGQFDGTVRVWNLREKCQMFEITTGLEPITFRASVPRAAPTERIFGPIALRALSPLLRTPDIRKGSPSPWITSGAMRPPRDHRWFGFPLKKSMESTKTRWFQRTLGFGHWSCLHHECIRSNIL
jgi:hypothetical protein